MLYRSVTYACCHYLHDFVSFSLHTSIAHKMGGPLRQRQLFSGKKVSNCLRPSRWFTPPMNHNKVSIHTCCIALSYHWPLSAIIALSYYWPLSAVPRTSGQADSGQQ